jgi:hypothetical protein
MPNNPKNFNYLNRDYDSLKRDLMSYVKLYYPEQYNDFSESSVGTMLLELNAYVGDILSHHTDQNFKELFLDTANQRSSVIKLAGNLGYSPRGRTGSITLLDVAITVPVQGDQPDERLYITLDSGFRAKAASGVYFEVLEDIDFNRHTSFNGTRNRTIVPNYNASNEIVDYTITKTVPARAGQTKVITLEITSSNAIPFTKWYLDNDDTTISEVLNVISKSDRFAPANESDWTEEGSYTVWYEMESLPQERIFVDTTIGQTADTKTGYWMYTNNRFVKEYDENGNMFLTFGAGIQNYSAYETYLVNGITGITAASLLNNDSLGNIPTIGTYLHCRYRTGGGANTNAAQGTVNTVDRKQLKSVPAGAAVPASAVNSVINSVTVNNPIPAIGGADFETIDEIKSKARRHFSSQDRCVTVDDYISRVQQMPSQYGSIFRVYAEADKEDLNTNIFIITKDENGKLKNTGNDQIKLNVASYLRQYRILNDFVQIYDGNVINLAINFTIHVEREYNKKQVIVNCIDQLRQYFSIANGQMNQPIYVSQVSELLRSQPGVVNVIELEFYNKVGGDYSSDVIPSADIHNLTDVGRLATLGEVAILPVNNMIASSPTTMFEIKYPQVDIRGSAL